MADMDAEKTKARLLALKQELIDLDEMAGESRATVTLDQQSVGRLSRMDALQQQAMANATRQRRQQDLQRIEESLRLLDSGDYGYCENCGEPIPGKRLQADPLATRCTACAGRR